MRLPRYGSVGFDPHAVTGQRIGKRCLQFHSLPCTGGAGGLNALIGLCRQGFRGTEVSFRTRNAIQGLRYWHESSSVHSDRQAIRSDPSVRAERRREQPPMSKTLKCCSSAIRKDRLRRSHRSCIRPSRSIRDEPSRQRSKRETGTWSRESR